MTVPFDGVEPAVPPPTRWAWAAIDLAAIRHNVAVLATAAGDAEVWAVVKADGYGHRALPVANTAVAAGAAGVCVALVQEAQALRAGGFDGGIMVLTEQPPEQIAAAVAAGVEFVVYNAHTIDNVAAVAEHVGTVAHVHVHIDTGMSRVGVQPADALNRVRAVHAHRWLSLAGTMTHLACADEPSNPATPLQLARFSAVVADAQRERVDLGRLHVANSAATLACPDARHDMVRPGIAVYGITPGPGVAAESVDLQPALSLHARVSHVKRVAGGVPVSYGWRYRTDRPTTLATVPVGYADGVRRTLGSDRAGNPGQAVLIGGRRHHIVGVVTMDQIVVDVGDSDVRIGDEVVLIGRQGDERVTVGEWADRLDTIGYEIVCGISARVPRIIVDSNDAVALGSQS